MRTADIASNEPCGSSRGQITAKSRDVTEPANIRICRKRILCAKSVGFRFVAQSKLAAIMATVI